ncbi:AAA family ATPase [Chryseobacterium mulctrae]|uniref:AAA family ATPase n=1 Tax=Chryseobacterium mulctrae TaxID=2576777 RepID=UPI001117139C|nr:AAA family ATPase [Chryseobacterium mulctrae]
MKLLAKKIKRFNSSRNGFIQPVFEINESDHHKPVSKDDYPNNGYIFISDFDLLDRDIDTELIVIDNGFFINDDNMFAERINDYNASQKRINYNMGISNYFSAVTPIQYIPIYNNHFNIEKQRLISDEGINSDVFFLIVEEENNIYGPFERDNFDLKAATFKNKDYDTSMYRDFLDAYIEYDGSVIFKLNKHLSSGNILTDFDGNSYIKDFTNVIIENLGEKIEYTPIQILHSWVLNKLNNKGLRIFDFLDEIGDIDKLFSSSLDQLKWQKYLFFIDKLEEESKIIQSLVNKLYDKGFVEDITGNTQIENIEKKLKTLEDNDIIKSEEIIKLKDDKRRLEIELQEIEKKDIEGIDKNSYPNIASVLNHPEKLQNLEEIIENRENFELLKDDLRKLEIKKEIFDEEIKKLEDTERKIQDSIRHIKQSFDSDVSVHTAKLADAKMYTDLLNGININHTNNDNSESIESVVLSKLPEEITTARSYIFEIQKRLKNLNRDLSFNDVANLIITINHSFITILAGAPGVGKTSLVNKLSTAYGLNEGFGYLEVNCAKGWTSSRDLLGFYNPLTGKYQDSKTGLRLALMKSNKNLNSPYIVLLDEANLSPMEHYWSDFIKLADGDYAKKIKTHEQEEITFGEGFRFIATINHDHTTESLSNRLIDRASIIQIDKPLSVIENAISDIKNDHVFDFNDVQKLFPETQKWKSDEELIKKLFQQIKEKIESNNSGIIISPRKEILIKKYCKVATGVLEGNSYTALDFAVSQHIMPLVNGRGEYFEQSLKELKSILEDKGMTKSSVLLGKILERGKDLKHFKYVYY